MIHELQPNNFYRVKFFHPLHKRYFFPNFGNSIIRPKENEVLIYYLGKKYSSGYSSNNHYFLYNNNICFAENDTGIFSRKNTFELIG